jgi:hypothetical protein
VKAPPLVVAVGTYFALIIVLLASGADAVSAYLTMPAWLLMGRGVYNAPALARDVAKPDSGL